MFELNWMMLALTRETGSDHFGSRTLRQPRFSFVLFFFSSVRVRSHSRLDGLRRGNPLTQLKRCYLCCWKFSGLLSSSGFRTCSLFSRRIGQKDLPLSFSPHPIFFSVGLIAEIILIVYQPTRWLLFSYLMPWLQMYIPHILYSPFQYKFMLLASSSASQVLVWPSCSSRSTSPRSVLSVSYTFVDPSVELRLATLHICR